MSAWLLHLSGCQTRYWQQLGVAFSYPESTAAVYFLFANFIINRRSDCISGCGYGIGLLQGVMKVCGRKVSQEL